MKEITEVWERYPKYTLNLPQAMMDKLEEVARREEWHGKAYIYRRVIQEGLNYLDAGPYVRENGVRLYAIPLNPTLAEIIKVIAERLEMTQEGVVLCLVEENINEWIKKVNDRAEERKKLLEKVWEDIELPSLDNLEDEELNEQGED